MRKVPFVESLSPHDEFVVNTNFFKGLDAALICFLCQNYAVQQCLSCAGTEQQLAESQQRSADQAQELTAAQTDLDQLSQTHERLQEQLQVKVINLHQTEDSLQERSRQHRQLQTQADDQSAQIVQLRAALQSSTQAGAELESQLADQTSTASGRAMQLSRVHLSTIPSRFCPT
jgi:predicted RNase H-like nuclease (RuvC/YqgF family)